MSAFPPFSPAPEPKIHAIAKKEEDRYPSPFVDRRYRIEARRSDGSVLIGRCVSAPNFPRFPEPEDVPESTFGATYVEPMYFASGLVNHYRTDFFSGLEPSSIEPVNHVLAQWNPAWIVRRGRSLQLRDSVEDAITEHESVVDELVKKLGVEYSRPPPPSHAETEDRLRTLWRSWAGGMVVHWSLLMDKLIGEDEWLSLSRNYPSLWLRVERLQIFDYPLVGAWFKDPVRLAPYVRECITRGVPVYYIWTPAIEQSAAAELLRPILDRTRVPTTPPGLPPVPQARAQERGRNASPARPVSPSRSPTSTIAEQTRYDSSSHGWRPPTDLEGQATSPARAPTPSRDIWERFNVRPGATPALGSPSPERGSSTPEWEDVGDERSGSPGASSENVRSEFGGHIVLVPIRARTWARDGLPTDPPIPLSTWGLEFVRDRTPRVIARVLPGVQEKLLSMHRESSISTLDDFVNALLSIRARFDTLIFVEPTPPRSDLHAVSTHIMLNFSMKREEALREWVSGARLVLSRPHGFRAAIQTGGIVAAIARDLMPNAQWTLDPTPLSRSGGCPYPVQVENVYGHDDYLSDAEVKVLIGFDWSTVNNKTCERRSMFPPPEVWERVAHGVWTAAHQDWYEKRKKDIHAGSEGPPFYLIKTFMKRLDPWVASFRFGHRLDPA